MEHEQIIIKIVGECIKDLNVKHQIEVNDNLMEDLEFDSVRMMGLFYLLEEEFDIDILNGDNNYLFFSIETVRDLVEVINKSI